MALAHFSVSHADWRKYALPLPEGLPTDLEAFLYAGVEVVALWRKQGELEAQQAALQMAQPAVQPRGMYRMDSFCPLLPRQHLTA